MSLDLSSYLGPANDESVVSSMAATLTGSEILKMAAEIRVLEAQGQTICNLTIGDFRPSEFPVPARLNALIKEALDEGQTNYPPSDGVFELRQAVQGLYERQLGLNYPIEGVVIAGGARPIIYGFYRAVLEPGDTLVYPVPSWNNNHYAHLVDVKKVEVRTRAEDAFMPTAEQLAPHLGEARVLALCSPQNPSGTMMSQEQLAPIARLVVEENRRREADGRKPLLILFDQIYWPITHGPKHMTPVGIEPELARVTVFVDGISKALAATGVRVGWGVGPPAIISRMRDLLGHVGAWAPKPEQVASARFLAEPGAFDGAVEQLGAKAKARLDALYQGFQAMAARGVPVSAIEPQGAIYLSVRFGLRGRLKTTEDVRRVLLEEAGFAVVPFHAFGFDDEDGWCRLSVGAVSAAAIEEALPRVEKALTAAYA